PLGYGQSRKGDTVNDTKLASDHRIRTAASEPVAALEGGLQPFLFRSSMGTLVLQAQLPKKAHRDRDRMTFAWRVGFAVSRDRG
ncbi:unnamed protein product, partial [marine sediment metagenome]